MNKHIVLGISLILMLFSTLANAQTGKKKVESKQNIEAYYFHNTTRCVTCKAVEAEAKTHLKNLYGSRVRFKALNLDDKATKAIAKQFNVSGQTLLVVKGKKSVNLTNEGFLYAKTNTAKFKEIIQNKVGAL